MHSTCTHNGIKMESKWNQNGRPTEDIPKTYRNIKKHIHHFNKMAVDGSYWQIFQDLIKSDI